MNTVDRVSHRLSDIFGPRLVSILVLCNGIFIVVFSLIGQVVMRHHAHDFIRPNDYSLYINLGLGLTIIYLSSLLSRRKRSAFIITAVAYAFYFGANIEGLTDILQSRHHLGLVTVIRAIILPLVILFLLAINRHKYVVKSDSQGFQAAIITSLIILAVTFVYGTLGFHVLGQSGFHQQLSIPAAMHYTVDQLNITTNHALRAYNHRAKLFKRLTNIY
ncbi:MAG: hypothetical protein WDN66_02785 [Candidatus Saccharibacteria bacterium]